MPALFKTALVVGKFAPLHLGHKYLIDTAFSRAETVIIVHYGSEEFGIDGKDVYAKLVELYSEKSVAIVHNPNTCTELNSRSSEFQHRLGIAKLIEELNHLRTDSAYIPDSVFSSEAYGEPFASFLSGYFKKEIKHVLVDLDRKRYPVSATKIRSGELERSVWALM